MINQRKRIATGNCNITVPEATGQVVNIPLNLNFTPQNVYIRIKPNVYDISPIDNPIFYIKLPSTGEIVVYGHNNGHFKILTAKNFIVSKQKVSFTTSNLYYEQNSCKIINWVAIE